MSEEIPPRNEREERIDKEATALAEQGRLFVESKLTDRETSLFAVLIEAIAELKVDIQELNKDYPMTIKKKVTPKKASKLIELNISPSKAYLATQCMQWQNIKSGSKLFKTKPNLQDGIDKHAEIENDIAIVKKWLPENYEKMEVYQEYALEQVREFKGYKLNVAGKADAIIYDRPNKKLYVYDWKTGGSDVSDITEEQLILYAFCAIEKFDSGEVELVYVNPEMNSSMTKIFNIVEIHDKVLNMIFTIGEKLKSGYGIGEHCQYCPAKSACPELLKQLKLLISPEVNGKEIEKFSEMQLDLIKVGEKVIKELKDRLKAWLTFNPDKALHGYVIANRPGIREFRIDAEMQQIAETLGVSIDELFERKVKSVKKLEDAGLEINLVSDFIFQPSSKVLKKM